MKLRKTEIFMECYSVARKKQLRALEVWELRRNPIEDGAISGFSGQKSVPKAKYINNCLK